MNFTVIPNSSSYGPIPTKTLRYSIAMKHCLLAKMNMKSTIQDSDGVIVSEKEQSEYLFRILG